jgi:dTDP-4-amino-4,6-dideoxygalactose transaminase
MKTIKSKTDLAINGAEPAFVEPLHVGRPNMGSRAAFHQYIDDIFDRRWLTNNGPLVQELETAVARHHKVKHCVAICNGTVALEIAIRALKLDGEVIVPSYTFIATAHALHWQAITPVFADINPATYCLDADAVRQMITPRTSGIIGVHLWGRPSHLDELQQIADEFDLHLMYDAAHAFGCTYHGVPVGSFGECEVLSFHATKFFNSFEGGAILTNNDALADTMRLMRNFGFAGEDNVIHPGTNGKMTEIAAAMGLVNITQLDDVIACNQANFQSYQAGLATLPGIRLLPYNDAEQNNFQYVVIAIGDEFPVTRDAVLHALKAENILARKYFWPGCHKMKPFKELFPHAGLMLPHTERLAAQILVLPTGTTMDTAKIKIITDILGLLAHP